MRIKEFSDFDNLSEGMGYHLRNEVSLTESVYRIESEAWLDLINESRDMWLNDKLDLSFDDVFLISTDAGSKSTYRGEEVLLDVPFEINEAEYKGRDVELN